MCFIITEIDWSEIKSAVFIGDKRVFTYFIEMKESLVLKQINLPIERSNASIDITSNRTTDLNVKVSFSFSFSYVCTMIVSHFRISRPSLALSSHAALLLLSDYINMHRRRRRRRKKERKQIANRFVCIGSFFWLISVWSGLQRCVNDTQMYPSWNEIEHLLSSIG